MTGRDTEQQILHDHYLMPHWCFARVPKKGRGATSSNLMRKPRKTCRMQQANLNTIVVSYSLGDKTVGLGPSSTAFSAMRFGATSLLIISVPQFYKIWG